MTAKPQTQTQAAGPQRLLLAAAWLGIPHGPINISLLLLLIASELTFKCL